MQKRRYRPIDPSTLPRHFDSNEAEERWHRFWQEDRVYTYDPEGTREDSFVVDTPPPTVSGSLHIGHVFSYTHTDIIVRYKRMIGKNIFYPLGWDDNGLPTERRVQNFYHVQCEPTLPYEEGLVCEQASSKQRKGHARPVSRQNFIELCDKLTLQDEQAFKELWQRAGLSVDWEQTYATVDSHCRHLAQLSFLDLHEKGHVYSSEAPTMWDVDFRTAVAQAELEDREQPGAYYHVAFGIQDEDRSFTIATTRPELLAACVGVTAHPDDKRYQDLFGKNAVTPLYHVPVPIFPSEVADPEKGTGILMVCTFGDATDVDWWRERNLALRQILGRDGRLQAITFGDDNWPSLKPDLAQELYDEIAGKSVKAAQQIVAEQLRSPRGSATGQTEAGPPLQREPEPITHPVKYYEKGSRPIEFVPTRQWFVRLMDKKDLLIEKGREISWHPDYMQLRYENWTEGLQFDWCISRQRYFGVSFPIWYPLDGTGEPKFAEPILATPEQLPVDPMIQVPAGYTEDRRNKPGGFTGERDIFDTWFTSSLTPQIMSGWTLDPERHERLFPMDLRPQAHDIIRTWAFYTIAKAALHENRIPWKHAVISGFIVDPDRKKMSKSKGNVVTPMEFLERYSADGVRYWAAQANLGTDTIFDEQMMKIGRRLVTKLFNAGKFVLSQTCPAETISAEDITEELDRAFVDRLRRLVARCTESFESFEFAKVISEVEDFFWHSLTDTYLELVKTRAKGQTAKQAAGQDDGDAVSVSDQARISAVATLRFGLENLVKMFAPFIPYIAEEVWSWAFAAETGSASVHSAPWPKVSDFAGVPAPELENSFETAIAALGAIHKHKTLSKVSVGTVITTLELEVHPDTAQVLASVIGDVMAGARVVDYTLTESAAVEEGAFSIIGAAFKKRDGDDA